MGDQKIEEKERNYRNLSRTNYLTVGFVCVVWKEEDSMIIRSPEPDRKNVFRRMG